MKRKCYIAKYPLNKEGNDLDEVILKCNTYCSPDMRKFWDELVAVRNPQDPMLQMWYSDEYQVDCLATTNQPFKLP